MRPVKEIENIVKRINAAPSAKMDRRILHDVLQAQEKTKKLFMADNQPNVWRIIMKNRITKLTVAAVVIIAVLTGINLFSSPVIANMTDILGQIQTTQSVTYKEVWQTDDGLPDWNRQWQMTIFKGGYIHQEDTNGGLVLITDRSQGKNLLLTAETRTAVLTKRVGSNRIGNLIDDLDWIAGLHENNSKYAGREELDGKITEKFVSHTGKYRKLTIWVDRKSNLPVKIEEINRPNPDKSMAAPLMKLTAADFGGDIKTERSVMTGGGNAQVEMRRVMSDFVWNIEYNPALFSFELPEGYTLETSTHNVSVRGVHDLIDALAFWTEMSEGYFPSDISELGDIDRLKAMLIKKYDSDGNPDTELSQAIEMAHTVFKGLTFIQQLKSKDNWYYAGKSVRFGDSNSPVFWYKPKKDSDVFRLVNGDLLITEVKLEDLPIQISR